MAAIAAFFFSPIGRYAILGLVAAALWGHGYFKGGAHVRAQCEEKARQAQEAANRQDNTAGQRQAESDVKVDAELRDLTAKQAARIKELETNANALQPTCIYPLPAPKRNPPAPGVRAAPARP